MAEVTKFPHLVWDRAKPGLMAVNGAARRFVNESTSYHEFGLAMYESHKSVPTIPAFLICDSAFLRKWGLGLALPGGRPFRWLVKAGYLVEGATIDDLAQQLGLDPAALASTVSRFNALAEKGEDTDFGKGGNAYNRYLGDPRSPRAIPASDRSQGSVLCRAGLSRRYRHGRRDGHGPLRTRAGRTRPAIPGSMPVATI